MTKVVPRDESAGSYLGVSTKIDEHQKFTPYSHRNASIFNEYDPSPSRLKDMH